MDTPTHRILSLLVLVAALGLLVGCGGDDHDDHGHDHGSDSSHDHDADGHHAGKHGGALVETDDHKAHFEIVHEPAAQRVTLYVLDGDMGYRGIGDTPVLNLVGPDGSVKVEGTMTDAKGEMAAAEWHFVHDLLSGTPDGRFRVKVGGSTYMPECVYDADHHGHDDDAVGPHDGMVAKFSCPDGTAGFVELKLHDDKGDLELWIASDEKITQPMDLPIDSKITVTFTEPKATVVTLQARNKDRNEDEDDQPNNRDGKTNYFIFPGDTGGDASWLMGTEFKGHVVITFSDGNKKFESVDFALIPHTHGAGGHAHK